MTPNKLEFCKKVIYRDGSLISFPDRPYLPAVYGCGHRNLVLRWSRQTEKSTYLCNSIVYEAVANPGSTILFVAPREQQVRLFVRTRLLPVLRNSPLLRRYLLGKSSTRIPIGDIEFANGSRFHARAAYHSADASRGISADLLVIDEVQDVAAGDLPVLQETLSHSARGRTFLTGTPKLDDNHIEQMFALSTANEWTVTCPQCKRGVILDENCLGPTSIVCPSCQSPLDVRSGRWIPRNPGSTWGDGYWVCHAMRPWKTYDDVLECQRVYDFARFRNEVLGLPVSLGEHLVTRAELEACCGERPMAQSQNDVADEYQPFLVAGIDWGGGGAARTVVVIGHMHLDFVFEVVHFACYRPDEHPDHVLQCVAELCQRFGVRIIAGDGGGNGNVYNRLLLARLKIETMYAVLYADTDQAPRQDGDLYKWTVNRTGTIGALFSRVKVRKIIFPRSEDCGSFLDEFACEIAEYDDERRMVRYTHPETQPDDALHATNYALLPAIRGFNDMREALYE